MSNRLAHETSPYLQQHAGNPVDWYPWGPEALAEAKRTGKPILLSIGYSACHWCHVMAHESFEDADVAAVMNELFVNIKVDREERPDIDQVYQSAQAWLTQRQGGWPLTMFLCADQVPFFGGTYFPKAARYGLPAFPDLLRRVREFHDEGTGEIAEQSRRLVDALTRMGPGRAESGALTAAPIARAAELLAQSFDETHGGFGGAPKFPHPDAIELLLRRHAAGGGEDAAFQATYTLGRMAEGGIFDQAGGGFSRYSVDAAWAIPHFEKMLYDNGWLLRLYAEAFALTHEPLFAEVAERTAAWVTREMQSPDGGYYSSLDADSEGHEGKYYVWTPAEVRALLDGDEYAVAAPHFGLDAPPNFEGTAWHLVVAKPLEGIAPALGIDMAEARRLIDGARRKLFVARERRIRPGRDEKILTSWNALMIGGMARAARVLGRADWLASARRALNFIRGTLWKDGRLLATYKDGRAHLDAYLDDHAFLLAALLEVLQADFRTEDLAWATALGQALLDDFEDPIDGGFFFTRHDHESLIQRPKPGPDNATPSGNGVAAFALNRLAYVTGDLRFRDGAERTLALFRTQMERDARGFGSLLAALEESLTPPRTVIVTGPEAAFGPWRALLDRAYRPSTLALFIPEGTHGLPDVLVKPLIKGVVNAWVCEGVTCLPPIESVDALRESLELPRMPAPA